MNLKIPTYFIQHCENLLRNLSIIFVSHKRIDEKGGIESMIMLLIRQLSSTAHISLVYRKLFKIVGVIEKKNGQDIFTAKNDAPEASNITSIRASELIFLIVNLVFSVFAMLFLLSLIKRNRKVGYSVIIHAMDTVYGGFAASMASALTGVPFIAHTHGIRAYFMQETSQNVLVKAVDFLIEKTVTKSCSILISVNQQGRYFWLSQGIADNKIKVVPVPVDTKLFAPSEQSRKKIRQELHLSATSFVFGYIGRLSPEKISVSLIEAFSRSNIDAKLVIIGDGPLMTELSNFAKRKELDSKIIFTGFRNDIYKVINIIDVLLLPSYIEGLPTVILEAFSNGKAVAASNIPANQEIIANGEDGILFNPSNVDELRNIIVQLHENLLLREKLAANGLNKSSKYHIDVVLAAIYDIYDNLLKQQSFRSNFV